ncbi:hypothetical protein DK847_15400 [Aestuariivirga litoralis]|uniref:Uncharacterized protein n=1 Tax=Aestuariivirga litoralis TaxID=2650924 RepID=A0A2W2B7I7_9HYPH|nr:hypothetical protein DK847_15400 [Aestuariivirga litoralis]
MDSNDATQREAFQTSMWQRIALSASPRPAGPHRSGPIHVSAWIKSGVFGFIGLVALIGLLLQRLPQSQPPSAHSHLESAG